MFSEPETKIRDSGTDEYPVWELVAGISGIGIVWLMIEYIGLIWVFLFAVFVLLPIVAAIAIIRLVAILIYALQRND